MFVAAWSSNASWAPPAMAAVTEHLGFGITGTIPYEPPYAFARRVSTLDHLSQGRMAWNVVTGYLDSAARGAGKAKQTAHDTRYDVADDYMDLVYKLWEASWDDDAVRYDQAAGVFTDPAKVRAISHHGPYFDLEAIHLCEPSPQRTPVIFQAGASPRGRARFPRTPSPSCHRYGCPAPADRPFFRC